MESQEKTSEYIRDRGWSDLQYIGLLFRVDVPVPMILITVDALVDKRHFYEKNGFRLLQNEIPEEADTVLMYFDLKAFTEKV